MARYGKVEFKISYVVDLDDQIMVDDAKQCVFEDVMNAVKYDEVVNYIDAAEDPTAKAEDVPEFLREENNGDSDEIE